MTQDNAGVYHFKIQGRNVIEKKIRQKEKWRKKGMTITGV